MHFDKLRKSIKVDDLELVFDLLEDKAFTSSLKQRLDMIIDNFSELKDENFDEKKLPNLSKIFNENEIRRLNNVFN